MKRAKVKRFRYIVLVLEQCTRFCPSKHSQMYNTPWGLCGFETNMWETHAYWRVAGYFSINLLKPTGYVMHQQFKIQQLYALPTLYFVFI